MHSDWLHGGEKGRHAIPKDWSLNDHGRVRDARNSSRERCMRRVIAVWSTMLPYFREFSCAHVDPFSRPALLKVGMDQRLGWIARVLSYAWVKNFASIIRRC